MNPEVRREIIARRSLHKAIRGRHAPKRKPKAQIQPKGIALAYAKVLIGLVRHMRRTVEREVSGDLGAWVRDSNHIHGRNDSAADDVVGKFAGVRIALRNGVFSTSELKPIASAYGRRTAEFQKEELQRQLAVSVGVRIPITDKTLGPKIETFTAENVSLIQSIPEQSLHQVEQVVLRGLNGGDRAEAIAEKIEERFDVSESRAAMIANDQTLKFFSSLNKTRQTELGITHFIWVTANDERLCDECEPLDGKRFSWDDAPDGGPGEIHPNCRCSADPDVEGLLDSL